MQATWEGHSLQRSFVACDTFHTTRTSDQHPHKIIRLCNSPGWYLATVIDLATREVIGYAMADHHRAELVVVALKMAAGRGALKGCCIMHSDRGSEYTSGEFRAVITELDLRQSMGRTGSCYDNAAAESFFGLLKAEIGTTVWETREQARADVFHFIEIEYNRTRLRKHPEYGYLTPIETRALLQQDLTPAA